MYEPRRLYEMHSQILKLYRLVYEERDSIWEAQMIGDFENKPVDLF